MENEILDLPEENPVEYKEQTPGVVILITLAMVLLGAIAGSFLIMGIYWLTGINISELINNGGELTGSGSKNLIRLTLMINHLTMFVLPGLLVPFLAYAYYWTRPRESFSFTLTDKRPLWIMLSLAFLLWIASLPLIQYSYLLNKMIPLPEWATMIEDNTEEIIMGLLNYDYYYEVVFNFLIIAIIPAMGEELIFRGIFQHQLFKWTKNAWFAILFSAACFSLFHMQLEGFLPRFLLGALLGYAFYISRNLWVSIFVHFVNNAFMIAAFYVSPDSISGKSSDEVLENMPVSSIIFAVIFSISLTFYLCRMMWKKSLTNQVIQ
jgi:membrane protease YdiL (CAAX protease family)